MDPLVPDALELLDQVAAAGYAGIDLGPVGYLGNAAELPARLADRRLALAGGFMPLPFGDRDRLADEMGNWTRCWTRSMLPARPPGPRGRRWPA